VFNAAVLRDDALRSGGDDSAAAFAVCVHVS
jgi:hypothetical protein